MSEAITAQCSAPPVGAGEQGILSSQRKGTDAALDDIVVYLDMAVLEEQAQSLPARERVADRRGELGFLADELKFHAQPWLESFDQRSAALLADRTTLVGGTATDVLLDPVERCDARQRLGGDRRRAGIGQQKCRRTWLQQKASCTSLRLASTL